MKRQLKNNSALLICLAFFLAAAQAVVADDRPPDLTITNQVKEKIQRDFLLREADVSVRSIAGNVRIEGQVAGVLDKYRVERLAKEVDGVRSVATRLKVQPVYARDDELQREVNRVVSLDPMLRTSRITVTVQTQTVTLGGVVSGPIEKHHAEQIVRKLRGVQLVRNNLTIEPIAMASHRHDDAVEDEIRRVLRQTPVFSRMPILVNVERGVAYLFGEVNSRTQKLRVADLISHVRGVRHIDNRLGIPSPRSDKFNRRTTGNASNQHAHRINVKLQTDLLVDASAIDVVTDSGFVFLQGKVPNEKHERRAIRLARSVPGVKWVQSQLDSRNERDRANRE